MFSSAKFLNALERDCGWKSGEPVLAAVSGGLDSVLLCEMLLANKIPFAIAHVNYGLRGNESDEDENFVAALAKKHSIPCYLFRCSEDDFKSTGENSKQAAARKIRYAFFEKTANEQGFLHIAVAHHTDDSIETALLNFARGTGITGMTGMDFRNGKIIRPLLHFTREELHAFAKKEKLQWREDSSNATDDYTRNRFRHHLLPWLLHEIPQAHKGFESSFSHFRETENFIEAALEKWTSDCCKISGDEIRISISEAKKYPNPFLFLSFYLKQFGFNDAQNASLEKMIAGESGSQLFSENFRLLFDRGSLILIRKNAGESVKQFYFSLEPFSGKIFADNQTAIIDADSISEPLSSRLWQNGDKMIPFGMNGNRSLSDILSEMKIPVHEKENTFVVVSGNEIVWVPGFRIADKFRVTEKTKNTWRISLKK